MLHTVIWVVHVLAAIGVIGLVLIQHGKGADLGAAFGSGSAGGLFGASGAGNFLSRTTAILAAVFFATSLLLTWFSGHANDSTSVMQQTTITQPAQPKVAPQVPSVSDSKSSEIPK
ncbi:MAG: preprotein translocase subunit SecG [Ferrovum sp. 37-45-19]|jgi:preprotein translocase subunit SecG|uniref:preprotein translocase subunit SecG n=1 Tax=Ferrovum sp. JA12 TaxID=1356299 RepID=UPI0007033B06|nr:preprotein translocase subunit SecG [Ferrovum sp. JA12]OYV79675.1 MAG: preprotein translocase subunit SecG [Ferrovum sp. 21-44-67]OYV94343.1 MAG: preprotein translocase subunit SecG [Ferrovum sp. 37-45-19]HQT80600.1 preprotein translocase subunit SecG [Ferrovaceae bacterium]KRH79689.1 protein-export membrane protein SecG [Ferrovum sp. JA12]HQU06705.1 preprotein translocase subunit SecG [Ferrovaceae bacterium]